MSIKTDDSGCSWTGGSTSSESDDTVLGPQSSITRALNLHGYHMGIKIGEGSFSSVRLAKYVDKNHNVQTMACKVIDVRKMSNEFIKKFLPRELSVLMKIHHPHIIRIHSILKRERVVFICMDYAEGGDLLKYIDKHGIVRESQANRWFTQLVAALRYLHSIDIAHRDLKCENVLLSGNGTILLADFGFARVCDEQNGTFSSTYCGSLAYAAPEVILRKQPYSPKRADVWSLGVLLFVMLNAAMPFDDRNAKKLVEDQRARNYAFDEAVDKTVSVAAKRTVDELLNPDPAERVRLDQLGGLGWIGEDSAKEKKRRQMGELCVRSSRDSRKGSVNKTGCKF